MVLGINLQGCDGVSHVYKLGVGLPGLAHLLWLSPGAR